MSTDDHARMMSANQANWDARTPVHLASRFYGLDQDLDPARWFASFEWDDLGELAGRDVLHLQCHLGTETIAFAQRGARAVGLDFSGASVAAANGIAEKAGLDVTYVQANVYDAVEALGRRRFDVVYTGKGALCYLPDLHRWAGVVARLLRPGGRLYLVEFHPLLNSLGPKPGPGEGPELLLRHDYLGGDGAVQERTTV
ncbi:class I SAM-dependent methyltransferase, partial [Streptomyces sp. NPDC006356]